MVIIQDIDYRIYIIIILLLFIYYRPKKLRLNDYVISGHANLDGRYYIGTYEDHHVVINMTTGEILEEKTKQGSIQGDKLMGTMTSPTFVIEGNTIQFKLGGGCDIKTMYNIVLFMLFIN